MSSFMSNDKLWKIFFLTLKRIGILLAFPLILPLFRETQLSVMFCCLLYESHTTEEYEDFGMRALLIVWVQKE